MLQEIRDRSQGWIACVIVGVIVIIFALTGFDAIFRAVSTDDQVATVNGEAVSKAEFSLLLERQKSMLRMQLGDRFDESPEATKKLKEGVLKSLINYRLLLQDVHATGFSYNAPAQIVREIQSSPEFQDANGNFDSRVFAESIRQLGYYSEEQLINDLMDQTLISQLQMGITQTTFATSHDLDYLARLLKQTRNFSYHKIATSELADISDERINTWYEANKDSLKTPEQVIIEYVELKKESLLDKVKVSDDEVNLLFTQRTAQTAASTGRQRISHILITVSGDEEENAKAQVDEIAAQLKQGKDFVALAKEYSKDSGTANKGGDLGYIGDEDLPDPAFVTALNELKTVGDVAAPVRSRFGWHLIKLTDIEKPKTIVLDARLRDQLTDEIKQEKVRELYIAEQRKLANATFESFDVLDQVAKDFGLKLETSEPFSRETGYSAVTASDKVIATVFSESALKDKENSEIIDLTPNLSVIVRVKEHLLPKPMTLEQATTDIKKKLQVEDAKLKGQQVVAELKAGTAVAMDDWEKAENAPNPLQTRMAPEFASAINPEILQAAFAMPKPAADKPEAFGVTLKNGDYVVIYLTQVTEFKGELSVEDKEQYQEIIKASLANNFWTEYQKYIKDKAKIEEYTEQQ